MLFFSLHTFSTLFKTVSSATFKFNANALGVFSS
ncbi:unnamed protein product [Larinioides sclopetarius]|uniref:Uncharacterized protein n=1 Tax=Larinioides sclopetarius TaxID=280406 RepID=A0AAV1ZCK0_9ARAC